MDRLRTHISLYQLARIWGISPSLLQGQCGCDNNSKKSEQWAEYADDNRVLTREDVLTAVELAETRLEGLLGYPIAPKWFADERHDYPKYRSGLYNPRGEFKSTTLHNKKLIRLGKRISTVNALASSVIIVGRKFTTEFVIAGDATEDDYGLVFVDADLGNYDAIEWAIKPVKVDKSYDGVQTTITITGFASTLITPTSIVDELCCDSDCLADTLRLLVHSYDDNHGSWVWYDTGCNGQACDTDSRDVCFQIIDADASWIRTQNSVVVDGDEVAFCPKVVPQFIDVNYSAGVPLDRDGMVARPYADMVAWLTLHYLGVGGNCKFPTCKCDNCRESELEALTQIPRYKTGEGLVTTDSGDTFELYYSRKYLDSIVFKPPTIAGIRVHEMIKDLQAVSDIASL